MAKFVYKMQNILEIKYKLEDQAKTNYANARAKLKALKKNQLSDEIVEKFDFIINFPLKNKQSRNIKIKRYK